ncbi:hypothetical protein PRUPE_4G267800 [Prunus persica]|uniref:Uncharacterized protein n=1 Tax=Prunus persica TaxID=3760 RepID=A0A251PRI3_PRUPE|nr:hypothetical protein PRUPE_4G267800 [Prunus persica]
MLPGCFSLRGNLSDIEFVEFSHLMSCISSWFFILLVLRGDIGLFRDLGLSLVNLFSFIAKRSEASHL